jgi:uncharacterized FlaG/YvyC family protein
MTEEEISATGLFSTLDMTDFASSYQSLSGGPSSISGSNTAAAATGTANTTGASAANTAAATAANSAASSESSAAAKLAAANASAVNATSATSVVSTTQATAFSASTAATAAAAVSSSKSTQATPSAQDIQTAVDTANANLANSNRTMSFRVDAATGLTIATITNSQTGVVLQQIPGADIVALARMLADWSPGKHMLLDLIA